MFLGNQIRFPLPALDFFSGNIAVIEMPTRSSCLHSLSGPVPDAVLAKGP